MNKLLLIILFTLGIIFNNYSLRATNSSDPADIYQVLSQKLLPDNQRKTQVIAVCPFNYNSPGVESFSRLVTERVTNAIASSKRCILVERANLNQVFSEVQLGLTGTISQVSAVKMGNLLGAKAVVLGSIERDDRMIHIVARLVDVETGRIEGTSEVSFEYSPASSGDATQKQAESSVTAGKPTFISEDDNEEKDTIAKAYDNLFNGLFINIERDRNAFRDQMILLEEKAKTNPTSVSPEIKSKLRAKLRSCEISVKGIDSWIQHQDADTFHACLKQALILWPNNPNLILIESFSVDSSTGKKMIDRVIAISSTNAEAYAFRAFNHVDAATNARNGRESNPERENNEINNVFGDLDKYAYYSGNTLVANQIKLDLMLQLGRDKEADKFIKKAVSENISNATLYGIRAKYTLSSKAFRASYLFNQLGTKKDKEYEDAIKDVDKAIEDYSTMIALDPSGILGRFERAETNFSYKQEYDKAIADMNYLIEKDPARSSKYIFNRGFYYKKKGLMDEAIKDWKAVLEIKPNNLNALSELNVYYCNIKDGAKTVYYLDKYLDLKEKVKDPGYAIQAGNLTYVVKMFCEIDDCRNAEKYYKKACQYNNIDFLQSMRLPWKRYSSFESSDVSGMADAISDCLLKSGNNDKAIEIVKDGIDIVNAHISRQRYDPNPDNKKKDDDWQLRYAYDVMGNLQFKLAGIYFDLMKFREAIDEYDNCIHSWVMCVKNRPLAKHLEMKPYEYPSNTNVAYYNLGLTYGRLKDAYNAKQNMKKACESGYEKACEYLRN